MSLTEERQGERQVSDLSKLRPKIADLVSRFDTFFSPDVSSAVDNVQWSAIRAELLRLSEYEGVACQFAVEKAEQRRRAEAAESERDSLRAKLVDAERERDELARLLSLP